MPHGRLTQAEREAHFEELISILSRGQSTHAHAHAHAHASASGDAEHATDTQQNVDCCASTVPGSIVCRLRHEYGCNAATGSASVRGNGGCCCRWTWKGTCTHVVQHLAKRNGKSYDMRRWLSPHRQGRIYGSYSLVSIILDAHVTARDSAFS